MIPSTAAAVLGFLLVIAPGLVWELLRERSRPSFAGSTFREASRVALVSLLCTGTSLGVLAIMRAIVPDWVVDPGAWIEHPNRYLEGHYRLVARTFTIEIAIACLVATLLWFGRYRIASIAAKIAPTEAPTFSRETMLYGVIRGDLRPGEKLLATARLHDGTVISGSLGGMDFGLPRDASFLVLQSPIHRKPPGQTAAPVHPGLARVVLCLGDVRDLWLAPVDGAAP